MPNKLQSFFILIFSFFILFMTVVAPIELSHVQKVKSWQRVNALVIGAEYRLAAFNKNSQYLEFRLMVSESGNEFVIVDARPGDFPVNVNFFGLMVFDSNRKLMDKYKIGQHVEVIRSPDKRKYYFESGNYTLMSLLLLLSLAWWGFVVRHILILRDASANQSHKKPKHW